MVFYLCIDKPFVAVYNIKSEQKPCPFVDMVGGNMMKHTKFFSTLLAAAMVFGAAFAFAACGPIDGGTDGSQSGMGTEQGGGSATDGANDKIDLIPTASLTYEKWDLEDAGLAELFNIPAGTYYTVTGIEDKSVTSIVIPDTYKRLPVVAIWEHAFVENSNVKTVVIPNRESVHDLHPTGNRGIF